MIYIAQQKCIKWLIRKIFIKLMTIFKFLSVRPQNFCIIFSQNFCIIFFAKFLLNFFAKFSHIFLNKIVALILRTFLQNRLKQNFAKKEKIFAFFTSERKARRSKKKKENWTGKIGKEISWNYRWGGGRGERGRQLLSPTPLSQEIIRNGCFALSDATHK